MNIKINDKSENGAVEVQVIPPLDEVFHEDNTHWEWDGDDYHIIYEGDMEELADETRYSEDALYEALGDYEDECRDTMKLEEQIAEDYRTSQGWNY